MLEAGFDLVEREIGSLVDQFEPIIGFVVELGAHRMALASRRPLAGIAGAADPGDGRGGAKAEAGRRAAGRAAAQSLIEDAFAQILAVRACHGRLPSWGALNHVMSPQKPQSTPRSRKPL